MQYKEALQQLQAIVRKVEAAEIDVDELADGLKEANALIQLCRQKLRSAEAEVTRAIEDMRAAEADAPIPVNHEQDF
jgi:exodeoxyribonuclease VII small subunit